MKTEQFAHDIIYFGAYEYTRKVSAGTHIGLSDQTTVPGLESTYRSLDYHMSPAAGSERHHFLNTSRFNSVDAFHTPSWNI